MSSVAVVFRQTNNNINTHEFITVKVVVDILNDCTLRCKSGRTPLCNFKVKIAFCIAKFKLYKNKCCNC